MGRPVLSNLTFFWETKTKDMNDERYISSILANQVCQKTAKLSMEDFLQNELHEGNFMLIKVNKMPNLL